MNSHDDSIRNVNEMMDLRSPDRKNAIRMVVIEDDYDAAAVIRMAIRAWDFPIDVDFKSDGYSAAKHILQTMPEIVMVDMKLPVLDGPTVLDATKPESWGASVIIATGMSIDEMETLGCLTEGRYYIQKPVDLVRLHKMLVKLAEEKRSVKSDVGA